MDLINATMLLQIPRANHDEVGERRGPPMTFAGWR